MNRRRIHQITTLGLVAIGTLFAQPAEQQEGAVYDAQLRKIAADYSTRIESATEALNAARERIAREKIPLLNDMRAAEDDILSARAELANLRREMAEFANDRTRREQEANAQRLNISYFAGAASEGLTTLTSTLGNVEMTTWKDRVGDLRNRLDPVGGVPDITAAVESAELLAGRLESLLGGYIAPGMAVESEARELQQGQFVYLGPETFFVADDPAGVSGTVRARDEGAAPLVYELPGWTAEQARALASGQATSVPADVSGGKALQLRVSQGTWIDHINKGGVVGYSILGLGLFAALTGIVKMIDLNSLSVDSPAKTTNLLKSLAADGPKAAESALAGLRKTSRELFATGLRNGFKPKEVIEEHLHAFILRERLHHERWLPMLAVIAAASPLLGLLGTVVGMVKTFTLITVFGTGNAGKLSSGISEALVTTQLGLTVAIPTLVLHGFLSYRTQKNLSLLERYGVEFITASEDHRVSQSESA